MVSGASAFILKVDIPCVRFTNDKSGTATHSMVNEPIDALCPCARVDDGVVAMIHQVNASVSFSFAKTYIGETSDGVFWYAD